MPVEKPAPEAPLPPQVGCEPYLSLVEKYDWDVKVMMAIMQAESSCNPSSVGDNYPIRGVLAPSCGLFQVRTVSAARGTCEQLKDPAFNIEKAYGIFKGQGLTAWSVYSNKKYLNYL